MYFLNMVITLIFFRVFFIYLEGLSTLIPNKTLSGKRWGKVGKSTGKGLSSCLWASISIH